MIELPATHVHLWLLPSVDTIKASTRAQLLDLLSADELERLQRYKSKPAQHLAFLSRALVRTTLSRYGSVAPSEWVFDIGPQGKPGIVSPLSSLRFNISHTKDYVVCAVCRDRDIGVDLEYTQTKRRTDDIASTYFAASEIAALMAAPSEQRNARFFEYWTLKEAYLKAKGIGLSAPLNQLLFSLDDAAQAISLADPAGNRAPNWQFWMFRHIADYRMALAVQARDAGDFIEEVELFEVSPSDLISKSHGY